MPINNSAKGFLVAFLLLTSVAALAQQRRTPEERAQNQTKWMQNNLALTQDQNTRVYDIILHYAREADNTNTNTPPGSEKKLEKRDIMRDKDAELKQVLTGEQFQKYQAHIREMKNRMMERRAGMDQN